MNENFTVYVLNGNGRKPNFSQKSSDSQKPIRLILALCPHCLRHVEKNASFCRKK